MDGPPLQLAVLCGRPTCPGNSCGGERKLSRRGPGHQCARKRSTRNTQQGSSRTPTRPRWRQTNRHALLRLQQQLQRRDPGLRLHRVLPLGRRRRHLERPRRGLSFGDPPSSGARATVGSTSPRCTRTALRCGAPTTTAKTLLLRHGSSGQNDDKEMMAVDNNPTSTLLRSALRGVGPTSPAGPVFRSPTRATAARLVEHEYDPAAERLRVAGCMAGGSARTGSLRRSGRSWNLFTNGTMAIEVTCSTDGGAILRPRSASPADRADKAAGQRGGRPCGQPSLKGNIRYLPSPQMVSEPGQRQPPYRLQSAIRTASTPATRQLYYRRSTDSGATWGTEVLLTTTAPPGTSSSRR